MGKETAIVGPGKHNTQDEIERGDTDNSVDRVFGRGVTGGDRFDKIVAKRDQAPVKAADDQQNQCQGV